MPQESIDNFIEIAMDYAKAERDLGVQRWAFVTIERNGEDSNKVRLFSYDLPRKVYERKQWVIRWRAAKLQCQYPKDTIRTYTSFYDKRLGNYPNLSKDLRTLISAKALVTKQQRKIEEYVNFQQTNNLFFDENTDPHLLKVRKKLDIRMADVQAAEERLKLKIKEL